MKFSKCSNRGFTLLFAVIAVLFAGNSNAASVLPASGSDDFPSSTVATIVSFSTPSGDGPVETVPLAVVDDVGIVLVDEEIAEDLGIEPIATQPGLQVTPCNLRDASRNECIKGLFTQIVPLLKDDGIPEYNMIPIEPYFYSRGIFRYSNDGIQGGLLIKNMELNGIGALKVNNIASNFTEKGAFLMKLNIEIPQIKAGGQFKADVKFGGLRLVPKGPFNITIDNIRLTILTDGVIENLEAGQRLRLSRLNANVGVGNAKIIANGIFSDRNLNAMILNLVNENLPEIVRVGIPATRDQWAPILVTHINNFFANIPIDKFLIL